MVYFLTERDKDATLKLAIFDIEEEMHYYGKKLAENLDHHHQSCYNEEQQKMYEHIDLDRFYVSADYILAKMRFLRDIADVLGFKFPYDIPENAFDVEVARKYVSGNFYWEQMRYYTPEELEQRNQRLLDMVRAWKKEDNENVIK